MRIKLRYAVAGLVVGVLCLSGVATYASPSKPPVIFALNSIDVPGVTLLPDFTNGADAAAKQINGTGGFGGRKVEIVTCNTMNNAAASTDCAHSTLADKPVAEFGCETFWSTGGLQIYSAAKVPSFNCANTTQDFTNPYSFSINGGGTGEIGAFANWICGQPTIKNALAFFDDLPAFHDDAALLQADLQTCGKTALTPVFDPISAVDMTPYATQVAQENPDFILYLGIGPQIVTTFNALQQAGVPASKVAVPDTAMDYATTLKPAGSAMDGVYSAFDWTNWGDTKDPEVKAYLKALKAYVGPAADPTNDTDEWGYALVEWFYTVAKRVGFAKFNSASLEKFMQTQKNIHIPLSLKLVNPGPAQYPQQKQPYMQIVQWKNGKLRAVPVPHSKQGWVNAF